MTRTKKSIVFCHGIWADGCTVKRTLGRVSNPAILVGHSYGGSVITHLANGTDQIKQRVPCVFGRL
jgi:hypothetical protein